MDPGVVVVVVGAVGGGFWGGCVTGGCVGPGLGTVVVGRGTVGVGLVVDGDVCGGAVVDGGGPMTWARTCQMAAAPKAVVLSTTMAAARQRVLTPLPFSPPRLLSCSVDLNCCVVPNCLESCHRAHSRSRSRAIRSAVGGWVVKRLAN